MNSYHPKGTLRWSSFLLTETMNHSTHTSPKCHGLLFPSLIRRPAYVLRKCSK
uniref:Uncharacterized protein n=1 Tax=Populus trichocarpa TaxID=3694 RepID=A9PI39_POPTR|nr:unknown [Populus trichocarpa]